MDRAGALALARGARRLFIKAGSETLRFDTAQDPLDAARAAALLVHDDGLMRVPVLIWDDLLVRGYTEDLYREALDAATPSQGGMR